jgi:SGNH domain (fused to AT3 domains)
VLSLSRWTIGIHWWSVPVQTGLMLLLASASFRYVEKPLRRADWSAFRRKSVCYALSASVAASGFLMLLSKPLEGKLYVGTKWASKEATASKILASYPNIYQRANDLRIKCNMTPHHLTGSAYRPKPLVDSAFLRACIESPTSSKKILLVGDSFASVSTYHLAVLADRLGYDFRVVFGYGCPFPLPFGEVKSHTTPKCREIDEKLLWQEVIRGLNAGDLLVVRPYLPKKQYIKYGSGRLPPVDAYDSAFGKLVNAATAKGAKVMVIGANPTLTLEQTQSLPAQWFNFSSTPSRGAIGPSDNQETAYYHLIDDHLQKYFAQFEGVSYFSLKRYLCDRASACRLADGPMLLYKDHEHLTSYAFDLFFDDLLGGVRALLSGAQSVSFQRDPS